MNSYGISDEDLTEQGIFDRVARHLLTQNARCENEDGCALRDPGGRACAVGCLLSDSELPGDHNEIASDTSNRLPKFLPFVQLLGDLQQVHDMEEPSGWGAALRQIAEQRDLAMPEVSP